MINDGSGPAFPVVSATGPYGEGDSVTIGMSIRDYFAAHASDNDVDEIMQDNRGTRMLSKSPIESITRQQARYIHANRMLEAREK